MFSGIGSYLKNNPEIPLGILSTGADVYGASQEAGAVADWRQQEASALADWRKVQEEENAKRLELEQLQTLMNFFSQSMNHG